MSNKQIRDRFDTVWNSLNGLKAAEIENKIYMNRQMIEPILGANDLDKVRNSSLLRLLLYEFIIFADEKCTQTVSSSFKRSTISSNNQDNSQIAHTLIKDLKEILFNVETRTEISGSFYLDKYEFRSIVRKLNTLQQQLRENSRSHIEEDHDLEGTEAMIEQLEHILKKKEKRIRQLNSQLQQNFADKEELEIQIETLQDKNIELEETVRNLEEQCIKIKQEFEKYKNQQKEELLCGASEFMNGGFAHKQSQLNQEESLNEKELLSSTQILSRYVNTPKLKEESILETPSKTLDTERKTVKKATITRVISQEYHGQQEENLLESMRIYHKKPSERKEMTQRMDQLENRDNSLDRMLLTQAALIQRVMQNMV